MEVLNNIDDNSANKSNNNRVGKCGRKRKDDAALPSNKCKQPAHGADSFLRYAFAVVVIAAVAVISTAATVGDAAANANADADDACSDADALPHAFDGDAYVVADDVDACAKMLIVARHLAGAYASVSCWCQRCCRCIRN